MTLKFFEKLSQNFIELLDDKDEHNVIIEVENTKKSFTAHSSVLKYRSSYFRMELENIQPNENNVKIITKSSISTQIFDVILKYIYGGIVNLENVETKFVFDLMLVANEFKLEELTNKLETVLIDTKASWLKTHFSLVYRTIFDRKNFKKIEKFCIDIVVKHPNLIFDSSDFTSLQESALVPLLKRDDLQMKEVKIWDYVIKWGIAQNPTLPIDLKEWTKENFITLKNTLQQCLPYIRYFQLSSTEVFDKVKPYKKIIDKQLWEDINQYFWASDRPVKSIILPARSLLVTELPPRTNEPKEHFSTIISEDHTAEISAWIDHFTSLQESALVPLLKRDDLQMKEVKIWDYVIKWGIAQNPTLPIDLKEWTKENFITLKNTLQQCLPYIRYFQLSSTEVFDKVKPYKKIIDKQLWEDINQYFWASDRPVKSIILPARSLLVTELPPRTNEPKEHFSTIISEDHTAEISAWIDRKTTNYLTTNNPYKFELILRGTRDGFNPQKFWNICHGHASTVVVLKVKGTDEIIGGYNPLAWDNSNIRYNHKWIVTNDSFIFSLKNGNIQNSILSRVKNPNKSFCNVGKSQQNIYGPFFGSNDFYMRSNQSNFTLDSACFCCNQGTQYERSISSTINFSIVDYEKERWGTRKGAENKWAEVNEMKEDKEDDEGKGKEMMYKMKNEAREGELREVDADELQKWNLN
ncbi:hypothetical protein Glove_66g20 [Diversispora epigaea]|uniref:BTB domain-containing protein n=1 Tax=Diversispora epigaea TaxID=1348612 RepID=A0A397JHH3_9GLOM|nr:hypothetical protein Glove_66g20 [Diversispora epigaea]